MLRGEGGEEMVCEVQTTPHESRRGGGGGGEMKLLMGDSLGHGHEVQGQRVAAVKPDGDKIRNPPQHDVPSS